MRIPVLLIALLVATISAPPLAMALSDYYPDVIIVPDDFPTLRAALAAATNHDTIVLRDYVANESGLVIEGLDDLSILVQGNTSIGLAGPGPLFIIRNSSNIQIWGLPIHVYTRRSEPLILIINSSNVVLEDMRINDTGGNATIMAISSSSVKALFVEAQGSGVFMDVYNSTVAWIGGSRLRGYEKIMRIHGTATAVVIDTYAADTRVVLEASSSRDISVSRSTFTGTGLLVNATDSTHIIIRDNVVDGATRLAALRRVAYVVIDGRGENYTCTATCIEAVDSASIQVADLTITGASTAILLSNVTAASLSYIKVKQARVGVVLNNTVNATIMWGFFSGNNVSIYIERSWGTSIYRTVVNGSATGIYFHETYSGLFRVLRGDVEPASMLTALGGKSDAAAPVAGLLRASYTVVDYSTRVMQDIVIEGCRRGVVVENTGDTGLIIGGVNFTRNHVALEILKGNVSLMLNTFSRNEINVLSHVGVVNVTPRIMFRYFYTGQHTPLTEIGFLGNYWEGHIGVDWNGDGVLDAPYRDKWVIDDAPLADPPREYIVYSAFIMEPAVIEHRPMYKVAVFPDAPAVIRLPFTVYNPFMTQTTYTVTVIVFSDEGEQVAGATLLTGTQAAYTPVGENSLSLPGYTLYEGTMFLILPYRGAKGNATYTVYILVARGENTVAAASLTIHATYLNRPRRPETYYVVHLPLVTSIAGTGDWAGYLASAREFPVIVYDWAQPIEIKGRTVAAAPSVSPETRVELSYITAAILVTLVLLAIHVAEAGEARRTLYQSLGGRESSRGGA